MINKITGADLNRLQGNLASQPENPTQISGAKETVITDKLVKSPKINNRLIPAVAGTDSTLNPGKDDQINITKYLWGDMPEEVHKVYRNPEEVMDCFKVKNFPADAPLPNLKAKNFLDNYLVKFFQWYKSNSQNPSPQFLKWQKGLHNEVKGWLNNTLPVMDKVISYLEFNNFFNQEPSKAWDNIEKHLPSGAPDASHQQQTNTFDPVFQKKFFKWYKSNSQNSNPEFLKWRDGLPNNVKIWLDKSLPITDQIVENIRA